MRRLLLAAAVWAAGNGWVFAQCGGGPPVNRNAIFHVVNVPILHTYHHELTTDQIEHLQTSVKLTSRYMREPGLTAAEQSFQIESHTEGVEDPRTRRYCAWATSVEVDFSYTKMDVYISSQYPEGSCPYRMILAHENQHVAINQRVLKKYVALMKKAIRRDRSIPTRNRPIQVGSVKEGEDIIEARVNKIVQPLYEGYKKEVLRENKKIDTLRNYRRIQAKCKDW